MSLIRPSTEADLPAITAIYGHHVLHGTGTFETTPPTEAEMAGRRADVLGKGLPWLVAEEGGRVLGYAYCQWFKPRPAYRFSAEDSIYLHPDAAGRGLGKQLLADLVKQAEAIGLRKLIAVIGDRGNAGSIGVHRSLGFTQVGVIANCGWKFDRWLDIVLMERTLGEGSAHAAAPMKSKTIAAWLAFVAGPFGGHRFYLRGWGDWLGWLLPVLSLAGAYGVLRMASLGQDDALSWVLTPVLGFTFAGCCLTAIVYGLMKPEDWNRRYNPGAPADAPAGNTSWATIWAVVLALMIGAAVLVASIAVSFQGYFQDQVEEGRRISQ